MESHTHSADGALEGRSEGTQWQAPQCCPYRFSGRCPVLYITSKQTVPHLLWSRPGIWWELGDGRGEREKQEPTHTHCKWWIAGCGFPGRLLNDFQNILSWGPTFFGRAVMTQEEWPASHILWGVLWAALQRGIGTLAQESCFPLNLALRCLALFCLSSR